MESWFGPRGTAVRRLGTTVIALGVITSLHSTSVYSDGHVLVAGLAMTAAGLLLRIEAAITTGLSERARCPDPSKHETTPSDVG